MQSVQSINSLPKKPSSVLGPLTRTWVVPVLGISVAAIVAMSLLARAQFGSVAGGLRYVAGERVICDRTSKGFGQVSAGHSEAVTFVITNLTPNPIHVLGFKSSCTCISVLGLPLEISSGVRQDLNVAITKGPKTGEIVEYVRLYTDSSEKREITLKVFGRVLD